MSLIGLLASMEKMVPEGRLHISPFSVSPQGALEISSVIAQPPSLDRCHFCTPRLVAEPYKSDERFRPSSQDHSIQLFSDASNEGWGAHLDIFYQGSVVKPGKKATHKRPRIEGGLTGPSEFQGPVSEPNSTCGNGQLNRGSLHKQTKRNPPSGDVRAPVEDHDMVSSYHHISLKARQIPGCLNVMADLSRSNQVKSTMVTASTGVQKKICQKCFTPHVDLFATHLNHKLPLFVSPVPDPKAWDIDALNLNWTGPSPLTAYAYPPTAVLHRVIQKIRHCHCLIIVIAPGWPGMPWFGDLVQHSTEIPLQLPVSITLLKQSHNYVFHSNLQHPHLHAWCLGVDSSKNKASLWRWQREFLPFRGHQQGPSTGQSGPYFKNGAVKICWFSPLHL